MFKAEQVRHSRDSVYSSTEQDRHEHNGIVKWLDEVLAGITESSYKGQAEELLGSSEPKKPDTDAEGSAWMDVDGLDS